MIVVTGANGFIGGHLLGALLGAGRQVVAFDRAGREYPGAVVSGRADRLMGWLEKSAPGYAGWPSSKNVEAVVHLGAISDTTCHDAAMLWMYNTSFTMRLWDWCAANKVRLIYASSAATYGSGEHGFSDSDATTRLLKPLNLYGKSKHAMDMYALETDGILSPPRWAALKFFNVYGPGEARKGNMASMVCNGAKQARESGEIRLFRGSGAIPDGGHRRDFILVHDVVSVILWTLEHDGPMGVLNVGGGEAKSFNDLASAVFAATGVPAKISYIDMPEAVRDQYQDFTQADLSKLRSLGYDKPFASLEDGVGRAIRDDSV